MRARMFSRLESLSPSPLDSPSWFGVWLGVCPGVRAAPSPQELGGVGVRAVSARGEAPISLLKPEPRRDSSGLGLDTRFGASPVLGSTGRGEADLPPCLRRRGSGVASPCGDRARGEGEGEGEVDESGGDAGVSGGCGRAAKWAVSIEARGKKGRTAACPTPKHTAPPSKLDSVNGF
mmetsp:Transcript_50557/g.114857  ORF Transcript_50557/g.114857 Transcript_50557/m.114857 type:complete len:177 (-) Transcript_50557:192-722(-)